jgi:very-short-patch-repair endonuclease
MNKKFIARELRKNQTAEEKIFWKYVRNRRFHNLKFLRQYPIICSHDGRGKIFVADFYCAKLKLIIEIDGKIHDYQKDFDKLREKVIRLYGFKIIRFTNEEIRNKIHEVLSRITPFSF